MWFLLQPSQEEWPSFASAKASQKSTRWRKWRGCAEIEVWVITLIFYFISFYFFSCYWEQGLLNRRNGLFSFSPVVPHACSPSGCLFSLLNVSEILPFLPPPLALPWLSFILEYSTASSCWSGEPFLISILPKNGWDPFSRHLQSPIFLPPH